MAFENEIVVTANTDLSNTEGITLVPGVYFKGNPKLQWLDVTNTTFNIILNAWYNEACCIAEKSVVALEGIHDSVNVSTDEDVLVFRSFGYEMHFAFAITDETDVDTDAKIKALVIGELATKLEKLVTDFS